MIIHKHAIEEVNVDRQVPRPTKAGWGGVQPYRAPIDWGR